MLGYQTATQTQISHPENTAGKVAGSAFRTTGHVLRRHEKTKDSRRKNSTRPFPFVPAFVPSCLRGELDHGLETAGTQLLFQECAIRPVPAVRLRLRPAARTGARPGATAPARRRTVR